MSDQERLDRLEAEGIAMHTPEFERDIAETMAERERATRRFSDAEVSQRAERRERIATAVLPAHVGAEDANDYWKARWAREAVEWADALMAALDAAEARDAEATK